MNISDRITIDKQIMHGKPIITNTRVPVHMILGLLSDGLSPDDIIKDYYDITKEDIYACIHYAKTIVEEENIIAG
ncbi:DUF433 domain-containing protein [Calditrichota bacterium]